MLRSMTGQGQSQSEGPFGTMVIELRTVNNRHLKISTKWDDALVPIDARAESWIRSRVVRGTMYVNGTLRRTSSSEFQINLPVLESYYHQLRHAQQCLGPSAPIELTQIAALPGVISSGQERSQDADRLWEVVEPVLSQAIANLQDMRATEGNSMKQRLEEDLRFMAKQLASIEARSPVVVIQYRDRLRGRIEAALSEFNIATGPTDLLREVQIFADRCDISEEITRLSSHLKMFSDALNSGEAAGRKLDFVTQEMFREANTIGSKANDAEIAGYVVETKCAIERMRELVQNLE